MLRVTAVTQRTDNECL